MTHPLVTEVANDDRLLRIAREILGQKAVPYRAILFEKSGRANWLVPWHQDKALPLESFVSSPEWGPWSKKAGILYAHAPAWALKRVVASRIHLDDSTADNGPLRVIPGSHAAGVLSYEEVLKMARSQEYLDCPVSRGGVLTMSPLLVHSSSKSHRDVHRRVLHIEYAVALRFGECVRLAIA